MLFLLLLFYFIRPKQMSNSDHTKTSAGPTIYPEAGSHADTIDQSEGRKINPATMEPALHQKHFDIDAGNTEPDCDAKPMHEQRQNPPQDYPAKGNPIPTDKQRNAPKPPNYSSDLQKLIIMGYSRERAENALLAADFDLGLALRKLQER